MDHDNDDLNEGEQDVGGQQARAPDTATQTDGVTPSTSQATVTSEPSGPKRRKTDDGSGDAPEEDANEAQANSSTSKTV